MRLGALAAAFSSWLWRWRTLLDRSAAERVDREEIELHLELLAAEHLRRGLSAGAAREAALREFGGVEQVREAARDERGMPWLEHLVRDVRFATRTLRRDPGFTLPALAMIALGIGGVTTILPVVESVLVRPLPFPQPDRLVALWASNAQRGWSRANVAPADFLDWRDDLRSFSGIAAHSFVDGWAMSGEGGAERVAGVTVTSGFFTVLGVRPELGRDLVLSDDFASGEPVVVISHELWQRRFGGDPRVIGRRVALDGVDHTIVGVVPPRLSLPRPGLDLYVPFRWQPQFRAAEWFRVAHFLKPIARLRPGVGMDAARREVAAMASRLEREHPLTNQGFGAGLTPLREFLVGDVRPRLLVLLVAVGLLLLVACANVASLLFARATVRRRELSVRSALGGARGRLVRQLMVESFVLAGAGGALGIALGLAGSRLLVSLAGDLLPRQAELGVDAPALSGCLLVVVGAATLFGVGPGLRAAAVSPAAALRSEGRGSTADAREVGSRGLLMLAEVALAVVLLAGATLALRSFARLVAVDPGFRPSGVAAADYQLTSSRYASNEEVEQMHRRVLERLRALPDVAAAELASSLPLEGEQWTSDFVVEGRAPTEVAIGFNRRIVTPGYFAAMGVRRLYGPGFTARDDEHGAPVVVVNAEVMRRMFGGRNPVGQRIAFKPPVAEPPYWRTIVGVVADEKLEGLAAPAQMEVFLPLGQELLGTPGLVERTVALVVRARRGDGGAVMPQVRAALAGLDPDLPLYDARTLGEMLHAASARDRLLLVLLALFAALAMLMATVGVYGLVAFLVAQRRREIGIRLALGAGARDVVQAVAGRAAMLCGAGLLLGLLLALVAGRALSRLLYGVAPGDPASLAAALVTLGATAAFAAWLPARRATRVDPLETLRE